MPTKAADLMRMGAVGVAASIPLRIERSDCEVNPLIRVHVTCSAGDKAWESPGAEGLDPA